MPHVSTRLSLKCPISTKPFELNYHVHRSSFSSSFAGSSHGAENGNAHHVQTKSKAHTWQGGTDNPAQISALTVVFLTHAPTLIKRSGASRCRVDGGANE